MNNTNETGVYDMSILILSISSSSLSILGSFAIFGSYILIEDIRNSTRKLVTCLTVADFLSALGYLTTALAHFTNTQDKVCTTQSFITAYSSIVSFYLTAAIAIHIFSTVVYRNDSTSSRKFLVWANIISWVTPAIIIAVAGHSDILGRDTAESVGTGPWCWIKRHHKNYIFWVFMAGKGWEFLCYLITTSLYVLLKFKMCLQRRRKSLRDIHESLRVDDKNYLYVWFVLYLLRLWGSVRSMMDISHADTKHLGEDLSKVFMYMQAVGDPGQAFCNCILFCFLDGTVRSYIVRAACCGTLQGPVLCEERERLIAADGGSLESPYTEDGESEQSVGSSGQYLNIGEFKYANLPSGYTRSSKSSKRTLIQ